MNDLRKEPNNGIAKVIVPGDPEKIKSKERNKLGIPVDEFFIKSLNETTENRLIQKIIM